MRQMPVGCRRSTTNNVSCSCLGPHHGAAQRSGDLFMSFLWLCMVKERVFVVCTLLCHDRGEKNISPFQRGCLQDRSESSFLACLRAKMKSVETASLPLLHLGSFVKAGTRRQVPNCVWLLYPCRTCPTASWWRRESRATQDEP